MENWLLIAGAFTVLCSALALALYALRILRVMHLVLERISSQLSEIDGLRNENKTLKKVAGLPEN